MRETRIALVQMQAETGNIKKNLIKLTGFVESAAEKNVHIICFPELSITGYNKTKGLLIPEEVPGQTSQYISGLARNFQMVILAGFPEKSNHDQPFIAQLVAFP